MILKDISTESEGAYVRRFNIVSHQEFPEFDNDAFGIAYQNIGNFFDSFHLKTTNYPKNKTFRQRRSAKASVCSASLTDAQTMQRLTASLETALRSEQASLRSTTPTVLAAQRVYRAWHSDFRTWKCRKGLLLQSRLQSRRLIQAYRDALNHIVWPQRVGFSRSRVTGPERYDVIKVLLNGWRQKGCFI